MHQSTWKIVTASALSAALLLGLFICVDQTGITPVFAADSAGKAESAGKRPSWPQFHGPQRDNISRETGLLKSWPEAGPTMLWEYADCGIGYSGFAIVNGRIYTAGDFNDKECVFALDSDGQLLWKTPNGSSWTGSEPGARTTPTFSEGLLYHMNPTGRLAAYNAADGKEVWAVDLKERFGAQHGIWAMSENLVVEGDRVLCLPGGSKALAAALDKRTGKTIWMTPPIADRAAYGSPMVAQFKGVRMMITMTQNGAVAVDVSNGQLLWHYRFRRQTVSQNANTPVFHDGHVFIACGHFTGGQLLKIDDDLRGVSEVWYKREFDNCHGDILLLDGKLYACGCRLGGKKFSCVDFLSGETLTSIDDLGKVSLTYAEGMIYALNHKGPMSLVRVQSDGMEVVSQFDLPKKGHGPIICHPVICDGRLYLRRDKFMYCYDIGAE
jgi:outer membrane protein assembly factor BamB